MGPAAQGLSRCWEAQEVGAQLWALGLRAAAILARHWMAWQPKLGSCSWSWQADRSIVPGVRRLLEGLRAGLLSPRTQ